MAVWLSYLAGYFKTNLQQEYHDIIVIVSFSQFFFLFSEFPLCSFSLLSFIILLSISYAHTLIFMEIVWMHDYTTSRCMMLGMSNQCIEFKLHKKVFYTPVCTRMMVIDPLFHSTTF